MKIIITTIFLAVGFYLIASTFFTSVPVKLREAVKMRNETGLSDLQMMLRKASEKLSTYIKLRPAIKGSLDKQLKIIGSSVTPEFYMADIIVSAAFYSALGLALTTVSFSLGIIFMIAIFFATYVYQRGALKRKLNERKQAIERELPQFAGTIRQQLNSTREIVSIMSSYRKVCGIALKDEITRTINDIKTQNPEKALQGLEQRVGSSQLAELVRGLIAVYQGEDQTMFFEMLTQELTKAQTESVTKELENRPAKLYLNYAMLGAAFMFMAMAAISGGTNMNQLF